MAFVFYLTDGKLHDTLQLDYFMRYERSSKAAELMVSPTLGGMQRMLAARYQVANISSQGVFQMPVGLLEKRLTEAQWTEVRRAGPDAKVSQITSCPANFSAADLTAADFKCYRSLCTPCTHINAPRRPILETFELSPAIPQLPSGDIEKTADFFKNYLGFEIVSRMPEHKFLIVRRGPAEIHFWQATDEKEARSIAIASSCYIRVKNISALFEDLCARKTKFRYPLQKMPWGMREFQVDDAYGNAIKFGEPFT
jgi:uncharacterized glyoxalase superfamily protein PhnB